MKGEQGQAGWYYPVYTKTEWLLGDLADTFMTEEEAQMKTVAIQQEKCLATSKLKSPVASGITPQSNDQGAGKGTVLHTPASGRASPSGWEKVACDEHLGMALGGSDGVFHKLQHIAQVNEEILKAQSTLVPEKSHLSNVSGSA